MLYMCLWCGACVDVCNACMVCICECVCCNVFVGVCVACEWWVLYVCTSKQLNFMDLETVLSNK